MTKRGGSSAAHMNLSCGGGNNGRLLLRGDFMYNWKDIVSVIMHGEKSWAWIKLTDNNQRKTQRTPFTALLQQKQKQNKQTNDELKSIHFSWPLFLQQTLREQAKRLLEPALQWHRCHILNWSHGQDTRQEAESSRRRSREVMDTCGVYNYIQPQHLPTWCLVNQSQSPFVISMSRRKRRRGGGGSCPSVSMCFFFSCLCQKRTTADITTDCN